MWPKAAAVVVDMDLEKFFDRVNHDLLMEKAIDEDQRRRVLALIRRFLEAGMMAEGIVRREEGTPQGGPLRPLLSNILLTTWTRNWNAADTRSAGTPTTATSMSKRRRPGNGCMANVTEFLEERAQA